MSTEKTSPAETLLGSSMLVACVRCGSSATYRGSPEKINEAAKVFYEIHERCWQRNKPEQTK